MRPPQPPAHGRNGKRWRESLNRTGDEGDVGSSVADDTSGTNRVPVQEHGRHVGVTSPREQSEDSGRVGKRPLTSILLEAAFLLFMGDAMQPGDSVEQQQRKLVVLFAVVWHAASLPALLAIAGVDMYTTSALMMLLSALAGTFGSVVFYVLMRKRRDVSDAIFAAQNYWTMLVVWPLLELAFPGQMLLLVLTVSVPRMALLAPPHSNILTVGTAALSVMDLYNNFAVRFQTQLLGFEPSQRASIFMIVYLSCAVCALLLQGPLQRNVARKADAKRTASEGLVTEAVAALIAFNTQALDIIHERAQEEGATSAFHLATIEGIIESVARYRPHIPHWVLDAAVMSSIGKVETEALVVSTMPSAANDERSQRSSRHHRRSDLSLRNPGGSMAASVTGASMTDVQSSRSRMSRYASAAGDVVSVKSRRSEGAAAATGLQASPLYLARTRPIVHRKITVAHLEFIVPNETATPRAFALLVDELLERASEFEASVHTLVGDIAVISWNAVKSIPNAELLACRFCAEVLKYVRKRFPKDLLNPAMSVRARATMPEMSLSSAPAQPRMTGAIMTGEARVCFAGTSSYEFCMSLPAWQPLLVEFRKLALARGMLCVDAPTRNGAGRIKARAVESIAVARRVASTSRMPSHAGMLGSYTHELSVTEPHGSTAPLIELARSPAARQMLGDSYAQAGESIEEATFDIVVYEVVNTGNAPNLASRAAAPSRMPPSAALSERMSAHSSAMPHKQHSTPQFPGQPPTIDIGDDNDDGGLNLALGFEPAQSPGGRPLSHSPANRSARVPALIDDPDDLITKGVHLAAMEKRYIEAARKFREALDMLSAKLAEEQRATTADPATEPALGLPQASAAPDLGSMFKGAGADAGADFERAAPDVADDGTVTTLTTEHLHALAANLMRRALKCAETGARSFAQVVVTTQAS